MKRILLLAMAMFVLGPAVMAKKKAPVHAPAPQPAEEIHWIRSIDELQAKMKANPKKVLIDFYTGWCGWCKKMDADTYTNPALVKYVNNNFYAVKFDAERQDTIHFQGKDYFFSAQNKANGFALELLQGKLMYPTSVLMMENFQNPTPVQGYLDINQAETVLTYFGDNGYRHQQWPDYQKSYQPHWSKGATPNTAPPPGH